MDYCASNKKLFELCTELCAITQAFFYDAIKILQQQQQLIVMVVKVIRLSRKKGEYAVQEIQLKKSLKT